MLSLAGLAGVAIGRFAPRVIAHLLPADTGLDAPAVGGAAVALGAGVAVVGLLHLVIAAALGRGIALAGTAGVSLAAVMGVLAFGLGVAAVVSLASGAAPAILMIPAAVVLGASAIGYGAATMAMIGLSEGRI